MSMDYIGYRYSRTELAALRLLLDLPELPGVALPGLDEEAYAQNIRSLTNAGYVLPAGDQICVDRLTALVVCAAAASRLRFQLHSVNRDTLICHNPVMQLLIDCPVQGLCTLTPHQSASSLHAHLKDELLRHSLPLSLTCFDADGSCAETQSADSAEQALHLIEDLLKS